MSGDFGSGPDEALWESSHCGPHEPEFSTPLDFVEDPNDADFTVEPDPYDGPALNGDEVEGEVLDELDPTGGEPIEVDIEVPAGSEVALYDPDKVIDVDAEVVKPAVPESRQRDNDGTRPSGGSGGGRGGGFSGKRKRRWLGRKGGSGGGGGDNVLYKKEVHKTTNIASNNAVLRASASGNSAGVVNTPASRGRRPSAGKRR